MISSALDYYYRLAKDIEAHQRLFMQGELHLEKLEELIQEVSVQRNQIVHDEDESQ
jgi:nitrogenase subunit NifH